MALRAPRQSKRFSVTDGDTVTFRSSDHVLFNVNRANLTAITDGPLAHSEDFASPPGDIVQLTEHSTILEILFSYVYPGRHPVLEDVNFRVLYDLAEAAEKYHVAPAMSICYIRIKMKFKEHPLEALSYAHRHGYTELLDLVAPLTIGLPVSSILSAPCSPSLFIAWAIYNDEWLQLLRETQREIRTNGHGRDKYNCPVWRDIAYNMEGRLCASNGGLANLRNLGKLFAGLDEQAKQCSWSLFNKTARETGCQGSLNWWREELERGIKRIPTLSRCGSPGS